MTISALHRISAFISTHFGESASPQATALGQRAVVFDPFTAPLHYPPELFANAHPPKGNRSATTAAPAVKHAGASGVALSPPSHGPASEHDPHEVAPLTTKPSRAPASDRDPHEVAAMTTKADLREVVTALRASWPELGEQGARTLAAQFVAETGGGRFCFNWNVGNIRARPNEPHVYLRNVWEVASPESAAAQVATGHGNARVATAEEIKRHGWACPPGKMIVVFDGRHPHCRFRAYHRLEEGMRSWIGHHRAIAMKDPEYLPALSRGDTDSVAHALKHARYYTASATDYAHALGARKVDIDRAFDTTRG
jgi:hypothetical protein